MIKAYYEHDETTSALGRIHDYALSAPYVRDEIASPSTNSHLISVHKVPSGSELETCAINNILKVNNDYFQYDLSDNFDVKLVKYLPGYHYGWHSDYCMNPDRKLSFTMQLSPVWDYRGGEVVIRDWNNRDHYMCAEMGSVIVFDSRAPHKVNRITVGERYALVAWAHGPQLR